MLIKKHLKVILSNRYAVFKCGPLRKAALKKYFRFHPERYEWFPSYKDGSWDGYRNMLLYGRVATGLFLAKEQELSKKYILEIEENRQQVKFREVDISKAHDFQAKCLVQMQQASYSGGIILASTGSGKTHLSGLYFKSVVGNCVFVVDELTLLEQARQELSEVTGEKIGIVGNSKFEIHRITVATVQSLHKHRQKGTFIKWFRSIVVMIIDELHVQINKRNVDVLSSVKPLAVFGLTATLEMNKESVSIPATALCGPVLFQYTMDQGVEDEILTPGTVCTLSIEDKLNKPVPGYWTVIKNKRSWVPPKHPQAEYRFRVTRNKHRNDVIETVVREGLSRGHRIVVLTDALLHLRLLSKRFSDVNHKALCGGNSKPAERVEAMREMDSGKVSLIIASKIFTKGVNIKTLTVIVDATALPSRNNALQRYGRGVRKAKGKARLLYIDIADRGNKFEQTAKLRESALRESGAKFISMKWQKSSDAVKLYDKFEKGM